VSHVKSLEPNLKDYDVKNGKLYPKKLHPALANFKKTKGK
jgi:hypothetical protein